MGQGRRKIRLSPAHCSLPVHMVFSWEEDRKIVLRFWSLVFSILAMLMLFSTIDGRMAYVQGSYTGYIDFWTDCKRHKCVSLGQVTGKWGGRGPQAPQPSSGVMGRRPPLGPSGAELGTSAVSGAA